MCDGTSQSLINVKNLKTYRLNVLTTSKKAAFTLAEILITLGVIGIVAAMTIPNLVQNYEKKLLQVQLKKVYSELSQINQLFAIDHNGENMCEFDQYSNTYYDSNGHIQYRSRLPEEFAKYLKKGTVANLSSGRTKMMDGNIFPLASFGYYFDDGKYTDMQGRFYYFEFSNAETNKCPIITVDINGLKKPDKMGYDVFAFRPTIDGRLIPLGNKNANPSDNIMNNESAVDTCKYELNARNNGFGCAYFAVNDISPEDETKSYWKNFLK